MKAFTLIESLITMCITVVLMAGVFMVLNTGNTAIDINLGLVDLQQATRQSMDSMVRELRQATSITSITQSGSDYTINFATAAVPSGISFSRNSANNQIIRTVGGQQQVLAKFITNLTFCCWHDATSTCDTNPVNSNLVEITVSAQKTVLQHNIPETPFFLKGQARIRNE